VSISSGRPTLSTVPLSVGILPTTVLKVAPLVAARKRSPEQERDRLLRMRGQGAHPGRLLLARPGEAAAVAAGLVAVAVQAASQEQRQEGEPAGGPVAQQHVAFAAVGRSR
jgi:hypothetical protein